MKEAPVKLSRMLLALVLVVALAGVAYVEQSQQSSGVRMTRAARALLDMLQPDQKARISFPFDGKERLNWHFVPLEDKQKHSTRKGLPLEAMTIAQREAARALLRAGTGSDGYSSARAIMSLENILKELEQGHGPVRNPNWYFFTVFGTPSNTTRWGWRVEGHHLSLNFVIAGGKVVAATPAFMGANPATVLAGDQKGKRTLANAEDLAKALYRSLDDQQKELAHQSKQFAEIEGASDRPHVGTATGVAVSQMTGPQRNLLMRLLHAYLDRMPADVAESELAALRQAGIDNIHFAYAGGLGTGEAHTYRIQGPTFVVEFLNVQPDSAHNSANHIHSAWRAIHGDFGIDTQVRR
jgi:Protein of unknown function (DUF3500)